MRMASVLINNYKYKQLQQDFLFQRRLLLILVYKRLEELRKHMDNPQGIIGTVLFIDERSYNEDLMEIRTVPIIRQLFPQ